jgi:hypothetical protein
MAPGEFRAIGVADDAVEPASDGVLFPAGTHDQTINPTPTATAAKVKGTNARMPRF